MPVIEVCCRIMSWDRCGIAPLELTATKWGVSIGARLRKHSCPYRGLASLRGTGAEMSKLRSFDSEFDAINLCILGGFVRIDLIW